MYPWPHALHVFGALVWFAGTMTAIHVLVARERAPEVDFSKLEGGVGRVMDTGATMILVTGIGLLLTDAGRALLSHGFMHAKLTVVVALLGLHGFVRASLGRARRGEARPIPGWLVPAAVLMFFAVVVLIEVRPF